MGKSRKRKTRQTKKSRHSRRRQTRKMWNMSGCGHKKMNKHCSSCKMMMQQGGTCDTCKLGMNGGNFYKPASAIPGPFEGSAWNGSVGGWPGVDGVGSGRNYLALNKYHTDPQTMMLLGGKKRRQGKKGKRSRKNGGGLIPQDLVNLGRDMTYNMGSAYNSLNGYKQPVNPAPYMNQLPTSKSLII